MTVNMSTESDTTKTLSAESDDKKDAEKVEIAEEAVEAKEENSTENGVDAKESPAKETKPTTSDNAKAKESDKEAPEKLAEKPKGDGKEKKEENSKKEEPEGENSDDEDDDKEDKSEEDGTEEEEGEGDEKDKSVPLLDQPLEKSGKRERKSVQRFNEEFPTEAKENAKVEPPEGSGMSLGNIPKIDASISRFKNDDMKILHRILFRTPGKTTQIKKNIRKFCGFDFKKGSDDYAKKLAQLHKLELKHLKSICEMLELLKSGTKDDISERILEFLLEPNDSGKGGRPKRTAAVKANNRGYSSSHDTYSSDEKSSGRSVRDKGKRPNLKEDSSSQSDEDFEPSDETSSDKQKSKRKRSEGRKKESEEDASLSESGTTEESDDEPKSKRKKPIKTNNKGKTPGRRGRKPAPTRKSTRGRKRKESSGDDDEDEEQKDGTSSSEDEPLANKAKATQPPTDDEIKIYVKQILEGANLEQITMKTVCQQVYAHYPGFDLAHKKDFIKTTVKSLIST